VHSTTKPLAAIDVGANTIHLVVARITHDGTDIDYVDDELELVRLGADVSATGAIGPERMQRALDTIRNQVATANAHHVETILGIGTEGVRAATNGVYFLEKVLTETGVEIEVVTGDQEASLTFWGGTSGLKPSLSPRAVLDLGGGSLELVVGVNSQVLWRTSLALGSGSMYNRYVRSDPSTTKELRAVECQVHEAFSPLTPPLPVKEVIVCGGTATTLAWLAGKVLHDVQSTSRSQERKGPANGRRRTRYLTRERLEWLRALIQACSSVELSRRYDIELGRAQLLASGIAILIAVMEQLDADTLHIRKRGIREGALLAYTHVGQDWLDNARDGTGW
jgi:exopolyphosphatase / guanosine-5'-triphosphate,3'-diphosphate pyrophosphatase